MNTDVLYSMLGGGGIVSVVLALIAWARGWGGDQADVAKQWEAGVTTVIKSTTAQVERLETAVQRANDKASACEQELDMCYQKIRILNSLTHQMLTDLEVRGAETDSYRAQLRSVL